VEGMGRTGCFGLVGRYSPLGWTLLFSWAVLTGCLANKIDLNDKQVASLALSSPGNDSICPGEKVPLVVTATLASGEKLQTEGPGGGKVNWSSFIMETRGAQFASQGFLTADQDPRETIAWPVHVIAHLGAQGPFAELDLPLTYACTYVANFNGRDGDVGGNGANGDDNSPGESGGSGSDGRDGEQVQVAVSLVPVPKGGNSLLSVFVRGARTQRLYYIDPAHSSLLLRANGGDGGDGGSGGFGWSGTHMHNGGDGDGGKGGNGGRFIVTVSLQAAPYMSCVHFENRGGHGGNGSTRGAEGRPGPPPFL
jgi:hypothetical protein